MSVKQILSVFDLFLLEGIILVDAPPSPPLLLWLWSLTLALYWQDGSQLSDLDSGVSNPLSHRLAESGVPLPSLNLLFKDGQLREWSGRTPPPLDITTLQKDQSS